MSKPPRRFQQHVAVAGDEYVEAVGFLRLFQQGRDVTLRRDCAGSDGVRRLQGGQVRRPVLAGSGTRGPWQERRCRRGCNASDERAACRIALNRGRVGCRCGAVVVVHDRPSLLRAQLQPRQAVFQAIA